MPYVPSKWQRTKNAVKRCCSSVAKKNKIFKKAYGKFLYLRRSTRYAKYTKLPIEEKTVIFEAFMARRYADSPRAIYEYMLNSSDYKDYTFLWGIRGDGLDEYEFLNNNERTKVIQYGTDEYYKAHATARYWVNNSRTILAMIPRKEQVFVQCWHGTPLKRLAYDIQVEGNNDLHSKKELCEKYTADAMKYTYMLSPSRFCTEKFTSAFGLKDIGKEDIIIEEGYPRNDFLNNYTEDDVKRVKEAIGVPDDKKILLYAPTWRDNQHVVGTGYVFDNPLDFEKLREDIGDEYVVLFRPHYFVANAFDFSRYEGFVFDVANYPDINDLYIVSDVLITDYSSVFFDYSILKRPILFYMYDLEFYKDTVRGFYISLDELPGPIIEKESELFEKIKTIPEWTSNDEYKEKYKTFSDKFTYLDDGHASERVVKRIFER